LHDHRREGALAKRGRGYGAEKRKKELARLKKQERKRERRFGKGNDTAEEEAATAGNETKVNDETESSTPPESQND
jgi:hypothetical protein